MLIHGRSQLCFKLAQLFLPSSLLPATLLPQTDAQQPSTRDQHLEHLKTGVDGKVSGVRSDLDGPWLQGFKRRHMVSTLAVVPTYGGKDHNRCRKCVGIALSVKGCEQTVELASLRSRSTSFRGSPSTPFITCFCYTNGMVEVNVWPVDPAASQVEWKYQSQREAHSSGRLETHVMIVIWEVSGRKTTSVRVFPKRSRTCEVGHRIRELASTSSSIDPWHIASLQERDDCIH
ncbi:hypothetical protein B0H13DRAFT_1851261 [Mycena leptocephala]|nr:hypothetical protein B0H13DRAFT_1851261 [Mycena leptocephala]